jgi:hypothetical protein
LACNACDLGLPPGDVVVGRSGFERCFFTLAGPDSAIDLMRARAAVS